MLSPHDYLTLQGHRDKEKHVYLHHKVISGINLTPKHPLRHAVVTTNNSRTYPRLSLDGPSISSLI